MVRYFVLVSAMNEDDLVLYVSAWTVAWVFLRETIVKSVMSSNGWWLSVGQVRYT